MLQGLAKRPGVMVGWGEGDPILIYLVLLVPYCFLQPGSHESSS